MVEGLTVVEVAGHSQSAWYDGRHAYLLDRVGALPHLVATVASGNALPRASATVPAADVTLLPPLASESRVIAVAQNYPAHAAEAGGASPANPVMFLKPRSAFVGHRGDVRLPPITSALDYEGEIGVVIGSTVVEADEDAALEAVAGYTIANDGSARDLQPTTLAGKPIVDWFSAKSLDRCSALGPVIVPVASVADAAMLHLVTTLNGEMVQDDYMSSMHVGIGALASFISWRMALAPGDVILTGTPAGVGKARRRLLADGDVVMISVAGLGELTTSYHSRPAA